MGSMSDMDTHRQSYRKGIADKKIGFRAVRLWRETMQVDCLCILVLIQGKKGVMNEPF